LRQLAILFFIGLAVVATGRATDIRDDVGDAEQQAIVDKYLTATQEQQSALRGVTMQVNIDAEVPKLQKKGKLQALRSISKLGKITYNALGFSGDKSVKSEVIARYLTAETQAQTGPDISITPVNYKFKGKGLQNHNGRDVYVFQISPRRKQIGLFKGELWLDPQTYMPVRESGKFVKNPSIFLKKMEFVRTYEVRNGVAVPQRVESVVQTRLFGPVNMNIEFTNFSKDNQADQDIASTVSSAQ
jgi:hypothetical protein